MNSNRKRAITPPHSEYSELFTRVAAQLEHLAGPNAKGYFSATCPSCRSKPSSLSILPTAGGFKVWCFKSDCTAREVLDALGGKPALRNAKTLRAPAALGEESDTSAWAKRIWLESVPAAGTLAEDYLRSRGITTALPPVLRFHARLGCARGAAAPALVALVQGPDGKPTAVQRTWLQPPVFGMKIGKANFGVGLASKKSLGPCTGGAVRLFPPDARGRLALAEGVETAFSFTQLKRTPCWAGLGGNLVGVAVPDEVTEVIIAADGDEAGDKNIDKLRARLVPQGFTVRVAQAPRGLDWNDVLMRKRRGGKWVK